MELGADDASRLGQAEVGPEQLLVGLLRIGEGLSAQVLTHTGRLDVDRLRADLGDPLPPMDGRAAGTPPSLDPAGRAVLDAAVALALARRREWLEGPHLLGAPLDSGEPATGVLARYGTRVAAVRAEVERML